MSKKVARKTIVLCDSAFDYKYQEIFKRISCVEVVEAGFWELLKRMLKGRVYYHLRYIKFRGYIFTLCRIFLIAMCAKFRGSKIVWSCHNVYEHSIPSKLYNDVLRWLLAKLAAHIVVFHKDVSEALPIAVQSKVVVSNFGDYKEFIFSQNEKNMDFEQAYSSWLGMRGIEAPDIVSVSTARLNNLKVLRTLSVGSNYSSLVIAPGVQVELFDGLKNVFFYNRSAVNAGISDILLGSGNLIGFLGHGNISVPTSLYMFASFRIPILALNCKPVSTIFSDFKMGVLVNSDDGFEDICSAVERLRASYREYQSECDRFIKDNTWDSAACDHRYVFTSFD